MVLSLEETTPDFRGLQGLWPAYAATLQEGPSIGMLAGADCAPAKKSSVFTKRFPRRFVYTERRPVDNQQEQA